MAVLTWLMPSNGAPILSQIAHSRLSPWGLLLGSALQLDAWLCLPVCS